uniref:Cycloleonurinin n=1 Tax=Leonurus japonicus TaxID=4138 RepID=Q7M1H0_LEOJA
YTPAGPTQYPPY